MPCGTLPYPFLPISSVPGPINTHLNSTQPIPSLSLVSLSLSHTHTHTHSLSLFSLSFYALPMAFAIWLLPPPQSTTRVCGQGSPVTDSLTVGVPSRDDVVCGPHATLKTSFPGAVFHFFWHCLAFFHSDFDAFRTRGLQSTRRCPPNQTNRHCWKWVTILTVPSMIFFG